MKRSINYSNKNTFLYPTIQALVAIFYSGSTCSSFHIAKSIQRTQTISSRYMASSSSEVVSATPPINFRSVKAVIFDIDGTLADSGKLGFDATNVVLQNNNIESISWDEYLVGCRYTTPVRLARHAGLLEENDKENFHAVGKRLGDEFDNYYIDLVSIETAPFFPGIVQLIENLPSNVALGALTNAAGRYAHAVMKANSVACASPESAFVVSHGEGSLYIRFGSILGADEVPKPKPFGDGLLAVCHQLNIDPNDCVYIGDASSDGMAAKAAGMSAIGVIWGANTEESLIASKVFDYVCKTVDELSSIIPQTQYSKV